jgi:raffinose/stachyose/melibiose transport system permease protein
MLRSSSKKKLIPIISAVAVLLFFGLTLTAYIFSARVKPKAIDLGGISGRTVSVSNISDAFFVGTADGTVEKRGADNSLVWSKPVPDIGGVFSILEIDAGLFVFGEDQYIYKLDTATGERLEKSVSDTGLPAGMIDYDGTGLYIAGNLGQNNILYLVKFQFDLTAARVVKQYAGGTLIAKGFATLPDYGEIVFCDGNGVISAFDNALASFRAGGEKYSAELPFPPLAFACDKSKGEFFAAGKDNVIRFASRSETDGTPYIALSAAAVPIKYEPSGCYVIAGQPVLWVTSKTQKAVFMIDTDEKKSIGEFEAFFDIGTLTSSKYSDYLYMTVYEPNAVRNGLYYYDRNVLPYINLINRLKVIGTVVTAAALIIGVIAVIGALSESAGKAYKSVGKRLWKAKWIYLILLPSIALLALFCYYPAVSSLMYSFMDYRIGYPLRFVGFQNFTKVFADSVFWQSVRNMFIFLGADLLIAVIPPLIFAELILALKSNRSQYVTRILLYVPGILPGVAAMLVWTYGIYGVDGLMNQVLGWFGHDKVYFLTTPGVSLVSLIMIGFPFIGSYLILYGGLKNVPDDYYQAARLEGCSWIRRILTIDIPLVAGQIKYLFILGFIGSVQNVGRIMLTTNGVAGTNVPINIMYNNIAENELGRSSAIALMIFIFLAIMTALNMRSSAAQRPD